MSNISDDLSPFGEAPADGGAEKNDPVAERLHQHEANLLFSAVPPEVLAAAGPDLRKKVDDIPVEIEVVIGRARVSVAELMRVDPGHSFRLDSRFGGPVELLVNGRLIGHGEIVADADDNVIGVRMIRIAG
ncbi:FliM/FliN family flagellar motor switch protein [Rhizobium sp. Rhizsp82]|uniref:FliM/FliN family flagellar motor switch protein n=1 Tax=Rhizobium sp. Rhizsp82 TaxID=3243057 RepID=UPI0039B6964C